MYGSLLLLHSWLRWLVLAAVVLVFLRELRSAATGAQWQNADLTWMKGAAHLLTAQIMIGVLLYATSPYIRSLLSDMGNTMSDRTSRLFAIEHGVVMVLALAATHMGAAIAKKGATDKAKHTRAAIFYGVALLLIGYAIPWMRPMLRLGM
jgi:hypothetical protein